MVMVLLQCYKNILKVGNLAARVLRDPWGPVLSPNIAPVPHIIIFIWNRTAPPYSTQNSVPD
jgi:hypothetical protein